MNIVAAFIVVMFGLGLITFTGVVFAKPAIAERFLMAFASSARTHYMEQVIRLLFGAALVVASPAMWQAKIFCLIGWIIIVSSAALMCVPWQWHHRFGQRVLPTLMRHLRLYAVCAFVFGALLIFAILAGRAGA